MARAKSETMRRLRLGDLVRLARSRYGIALPDNDAGLGLLVEMLSPISHGREPARRMRCAIEIWAPWMIKRGEGAPLIDHVIRTPACERMPTAIAVGQRLRVTNAEREGLRLWTMRPVDMTEAELIEQRKAKNRERA